MSFVAVHAAHERQRRDEEEERMGYSPDELAEDWEFKIVRSATSQFRKPVEFQRLLEEEAPAGWQLLEKLDEGRVRFKRPMSARDNDEMLPKGTNAYRTTYGISEVRFALTIVAISIFAVLAVVGAIQLFAY